MHWLHNKSIIYSHNQYLPYILTKFHTARRYKDIVDKNYTHRVFIAQFFVTGSWYETFLSQKQKLKNSYGSFLLQSK